MRTKPENRDWQNCREDILHKAKAFLCWDVFHDVAVQLVRTKGPVSYFIPPSDICSIVVFTDQDETDFSKPVCHLFHEAGHRLQYEAWKKTGKRDRFMECINTPAGPARAAFEQEAWDMGRTLLRRFIRECCPDTDLDEIYCVYGGICRQTYECGEPLNDN